MPGLPTLQEEDMRALDAAFADFLAKTEAGAVLLAAEGGFLIANYGQSDRFDPTTIAALAGNSFMANLEMARLLGEPQFSSIYQQGEASSVFIQSIDGSNLMIIIFPPFVSVGVIKHYASLARGEVARIFQKAIERAPGESLDLAMMNLPDSTAIFKRL
jgi:hypothetical protein